MQEELKRRKKRRAMTGGLGASWMRRDLSPQSSYIYPHPPFTQISLARFCRASCSARQSHFFPLRSHASFHGRASFHDATILDPDRRWSKGKRTEDLHISEVSDFGCTSTRAVEKPESSTSTDAEESGSSLGANDSFIDLPDEVDGLGTKRLFSNLNVATLQHEPGSLRGSILLVAGTTVGAGILAIPAVTQDAGFLASAATCGACWFYMVLTGLLVAEVNINTMCELGSGGVSLVSMAFRTLGQAGVRVACGVYLLYHYLLLVAYVARSSHIISNAVNSPFVTYLFIHYALLVAYVARSSEIVSSAIGSPLWLSGCLFTGTLGGLCYLGSQQIIGIVNGILVGGIIASFTVLVGLAGTGVELDPLLRINLAAVPQSIPIIALSFVYQNVVPVVCTNLEGDLPKIRTAIVLGTAIPLFMFVAWDAVILGSTPFDPNSVTQAISDPLLTLRSANGIVGPVVEMFSLLAVATSYIGFVLGLSDFLSDLLKLPSGGNRQTLPYLLTLLPPLALALTSPDIFFNALDFAGTYGVLVLFGILPAAMAWSERYGDTCISPSVPPLVPGGRLTLGAIIGFATLVIGTEILSHAMP